MGCGSSSTIQQKAKGRKILMIGLEKSGKTTLLYQISKNKKVNAIPTVGHNHENFSYKGSQIALFDFGGKDQLFQSVKENTENTKGLIFVLDGTDKDHLDAAYKYFVKAITLDKLQNIPILIFVNKCDLSLVFTEFDIKREFQLESQQNLVWHIQKVSAFTKEGINDGLTWLIQQSKILTNKSASKL